MRHSKKTAYNTAIHEAMHNVDAQMNSFEEFYDRYYKSAPLDEKTKEIVTGAVMDVLDTVRGVIVWDTLQDMCK